MTNYQSDDLNGWEFKILRANVPIFENQVKLKKVIEEEALAGWIFLEKFDQCRLRFKRKTSHRENDHKLTIDPYRTVYGMSQYRLMFYVLAVSVVVAMALVFMLIVAIDT